MALPTVIYFDIRARAEPIRLILEEMEIEYVDEQITDAQWSKLRAKTPFDQLPAYRDGELEIWQSHAIYRHLAQCNPDTRGEQAAAEPPNRHPDRPNIQDHRVLRL